MIGNLLCVNDCGLKTTMSSAYLELKLQFGSSKCKKMHVGKQFEKYICQDLGALTINTQDSSNIKQVRAI